MLCLEVNHLDADVTFPFSLVLEGEDIDKEHCVLDFVKGRVTFEPISSLCWVNGVAVSQPTKLNQGKLNLFSSETSLRILSVIKIPPS